MGSLDFLVNSLESAGEYLLALLRLLDRSRKAATTRFSFAALFALLMSRQRAFLVTHLPELALQRLQAGEIKGIDFRMVRIQNHTLFLMAHQAAFEFAGHCHTSL